MAEFLKSISFKKGKKKKKKKKKKEKECAQSSWTSIVIDQPSAISISDHYTTDTSDAKEFVYKYKH